MIRKSNALKLNRETVRELDRTELEKAAGGQTRTTVTNPCIPYSEYASCQLPTLQAACFQ